MNRSRRVIVGSAVGTVFEWYDFFVYGTLASILGSLFFPVSLGENGVFLASLATYGAGLLLRPLGAIFFGRMGDSKGRKTTFLVTVTLMGGATVAIGLLPTFGTAGLLAPISLIALRCIQGFALGGEYAGAAIYVAESVPRNKRGVSTGYIQICATAGFLLSILVVYLSKRFTGDDFAVWGWRIPFLISAALLVLSVFIRKGLTETPVFLSLEKLGQKSLNPLRETLLDSENVSLMAKVLFGIVAGVGVVWYTGQFYVLIFMQKYLRIDFDTANALMFFAIFISLPLFVLAGKLSDRVGRKRVVLIAMSLAAISYLPLFSLLSTTLNPNLTNLMNARKVVVSGEDCHFFSWASSSDSCMGARSFLNNLSLPYELERSDRAEVLITIDSEQFKVDQKEKMLHKLKELGYFQTPSHTFASLFISVSVLVVLLSLVAFCYGPLAAWMVELFNSRVRYGSMSIPYHIGTGYFGGFMLFISSTLVTYSGDIFTGLIYPCAIASMSVLIGLKFIPETADRNID